MGLALHVVGLLNVQYAIHQGTVYVLEVNPRASRTVPFVSKATGRPLAKIAAQVMAGHDARGAGHRLRRPRRAASRSRRWCCPSSSSPASTRCWGRR